MQFCWIDRLYLLAGFAAGLLLVAHVVSSHDSTAVFRARRFAGRGSGVARRTSGNAGRRQVAAITGHPAQPGPFVLRAELPAGYSISPYRRSSDESIVVLAGALQIGDGESFDPARLRTFDSGAFVRLNADEPHYATSDGGAVVQIMGTGPFAIEYVARSGPARERARSGRQ